MWEVWLQLHLLPPLVQLVKDYAEVIPWLFVTLRNGKVFVYDLRKHPVYKEWREWKIAAVDSDVRSVVQSPDKESILCVTGTWFSNVCRIVTRRLDYPTTTARMLPIDLPLSSSFSYHPIRCTRGIALKHMDMSTLEDAILWTRDGIHIVRIHIPSAVRIHLVHDAIAVGDDHEKDVYYWRVSRFQRTQSTTTMCYEEWNMFTGEATPHSVFQCSTDDLTTDRMMTSRTLVTRYPEGKQRATTLFMNPSGTRIDAIHHNPNKATEWKTLPFSELPGDLSNTQGLWMHSRFAVVEGCYMGDTCFHVLDHVSHTASETESKTKIKTVTQTETQTKPVSATTEWRPLPPLEFEDREDLTNHTSHVSIVECSWLGEFVEEI